MSTENREDNPPSVATEESPAVVDESAKLEALAAERDRLIGEKADFQDRLLRRQAEFDNFRRRAEKERTEFVQYAGMEVVREILPILDDFERALKVESADKEYVKGIELIHQRLQDTLQKLGLEPIQAAGRKFDPYQHQAVERVPSEEAEDQTVLGEFQRGYNFKGKLLRPSMVRVAVKPS